MAALTFKNVESLEFAPLSAHVRSQLRKDIRNFQATAERKGYTIDDLKWEQQQSSIHFELGCWLYYYRRLISRGDGLQHRIQCARRIIEAGLWKNFGYEFLVVFEFGERDFDTIFEMGDGDEVVSGLIALADKSPACAIAHVVEYMEWRSTVAVE